MLDTVTVLAKFVFLVECSNDLHVFFLISPVPSIF